MELIIKLKEDLDEYPDQDIQRLITYYGIFRKAENVSLDDAKWMIAIEHSNLYKKGTFTSVQSADFAPGEIAAPQQFQEFIQILDNVCGLKNVITIPAGTKLYRGVPPVAAEPQAKGDHWAVNGDDIQKLIDAQGFSAMFNTIACKFDEGEDVPLSHARAFARKHDDGEVYLYKTTRNLRLIIICECLDALNKRVNLVETEARRKYYCNELVWKQLGLDGFLNIDTGFVGRGDTLEVFICNPNTKVKLISELDVDAMIGEW